ncbi:MAG: CPBP family intramembrane glutamic endopeptidase [Bacteroidota bacterium]
MAILISILLFMPMLIMVLFMPDFKDIMHAPSSMTGKFKMMGPSVEGILLLLIGAIFKTALSEEILFRGFIAKRLIAVSSYKTGNIIQATLFGAIHVLIFLSITSNIFFLMIMFIVPALGAYLKTYINEKKAGGSILPGWIMHATSNLQSYSIIGFLV